MSAKLVLRGLRLLEKHKEQPVKKKSIQKNNKSKKRIQKRQRGTLDYVNTSFHTC